MNLPLTDIVPRMKRMLSEPERIRVALSFAVFGGLVEGVALAALLPAITSLAEGRSVWGLSTSGWLWALGGLAVASFVLNYLATRRMYDVALDFLRSIHRIVGDQVAKQPLGWFARPIAGSLSRMVSTELMMAGELFAHMVGPLVSRGTAASVIVVAAWVWDPALGALLTAAVPAFVAITLASTALMRRGRRITEPHEIELAERIVEFSQCQGALRSCGRGADFEPLEDAQDASTAAKRRAVWTEVGGMLLSGVVTQGVIVGLIVVTGALAVGGTLAAVPAVAFIGLALRFTSTLSDITESAMGLESRRPLLDQLDEVLTAQPLPEPDRPVLLPDPGSVELQDVGFGYAADSAPVLNGMSFRVDAGTMVALVGPSGSGKTTVAKLISRFHDVDSGRVLVGGVPVTGQTTEQLMGQLSMVFQDAYLFDDTLRANIAVGREGATEREIVAAAETAGVGEIVARLDGGWDAPVGEGGRALSGGERQRVALARALLKRAPIVLLDEATSALDTENEANVVHAVEQLRREATVIVIAHRLDTIVGADTIVALDGHGGVEAQGTHEELLAADGTYASYWRHLRSGQGWRLTV